MTAQAAIAVAARCWLTAATAPNSALITPVKFAPSGQPGQAVDRKVAPDIRRGAAYGVLLIDAMPAQKKRASHDAPDDVFNWLDYHSTVFQPPFIFFGLEEAFAVTRFGT